MGARDRHTDPEGPHVTVDGQNTPANGSLYDAIGGAESLRVAVDRFYVAVLDDPALAPYFEGADMASVKRHQALLLTQVLGGPGAYEGRDLGEAHRPLGIGEEDYDRVVSHLTNTLTGLGVAGEALETVLTAVGQTREAIVSSASTSES